MAYSKIVINQTGKPAGAAGVSRDDLDLYSVASAVVSLTNDADGDVGAQAWAWTMLEKPEGSVAVLAGSATANATFQADVYGRYVVALSVNGLGVGTDMYSEIVVGCRAPTFGTDVDGDEVLDWLPPAATEGFLANWSANPYGAQPELVRILNQIRSKFLPMREYNGDPTKLVIPVQFPSHLTTQTNNAAYQISGYLPLLDMADFPWVKTAKFGVTLERNGAGDTAYAQLYDVTNAAQVAEVTTTSFEDLLSSAITIGAAGGNLRNDGPTRYRVDIKSVAGGGGDTADLHRAFLLLSLV